MGMRVNRLVKPEQPTSPPQKKNPGGWQTTGDASLAWRGRGWTLVSGCLVWVRWLFGTTGRIPGQTRIKD